MMRKTDFFGIQRNRHSRSYWRTSRKCTHTSLCNQILETSRNYHDHINASGYFQHRHWLWTCCGPWFVCVVAACRGCSRLHDRRCLAPQTPFGDWTTVRACGNPLIHREDSAASDGIQHHSAGSPRCASWRHVIQVTLQYVTNWTLPEVSVHDLRLPVWVVDRDVTPDWWESPLEKSDDEWNEIPHRTTTATQNPPSASGPMTPRFSQMERFRRNSIHLPPEGVVFTTRFSSSSWLIVSTALDKFLCQSWIDLMSLWEHTDTDLGNHCKRHTSSSQSDFEADLQCNSTNSRIVIEILILIHVSFIVRHLMCYGNEFPSLCDFIFQKILNILSAIHDRYMPVFSRMSRSFDFELWRLLISSIYVLSVSESALQFVSLISITFNIIISKWASDAGRPSETWRILNTCSHSNSIRMIQASVWYLISPVMTTCSWKSDTSLTSSSDVEERVQCPLNWKWRIWIMMTDVSFHCAQIHTLVNMSPNRFVSCSSVQTNMAVWRSMTRSLSLNRTISRHDHTKKPWWIVINGVNASLIIGEVWYEHRNAFMTLKKKKERLVLHLFDASVDI